MFTRRRFLTTASSTVTAAMATSFPTPAFAATARQSDELVGYDATGLAELLRTKRLTQAELVEIVIRRIEALNPILNFMTTPTFDRARSKAGSFSNDSAFAGVPILIKDMIDIGGVRRTDGSRLLATNVPAKNVAYIDAIEAAGLNILGLTNVPEFAGGFTCNNNLFGETLNPWNLEYSPYISSGGSAAAAAAGILPLVHGTDGAGSNRLPASTCGLFGVKPSQFRMLSGEANGGHDRTKTHNTMSRTVRDSARLLNLTEDKSGTVYAPVGLVQGPSTRRLKIGFVDAAALVAPEVQAAQEDVAKLLQDLGHTVVKAEWPVDIEAFKDAYPSYFATRILPLKAMIESLTGVSVTKSGLLTGFQASFAEDAVLVRPEDAERAETYLEAIPQAFADLFADLDVVLCPVMPQVGAKNTSFDPNESYTKARMHALLDNLIFTGPVNFAGNPAMSVPLTWHSTAGLPIGSHFIAPVGDDRVLYELAFELEQARPWKDIWAPISVKHVPI